MSDRFFDPNASPAKTSSELTGGRTKKDLSKNRIEIIKLPEDFKSNRQERAARLEGRVTRSDPKTNHVNIQTQRGEVTLQLPKETPLPPRGSNVELSLPPDLSKLPATLKHLATPIKTDQVSLNTPQFTGAKVYQTPQIPLSNLASSQTPQPLQTGQAIRLIPLPPAQIPTLNFNTNITPPLIQALNSVPNIFTPLLSTQSTITAVISPIIANNPPPPSAALLQTFQSQNTTTQTIIATPQISSAPILQIPPNPLNIALTPVPSTALNNAPPSLLLTHINTAPSAAPLPRGSHHIIPEAVQTNAFLSTSKTSQLTLSHILGQRPQGIQNPAAAPTIVQATLIAATTTGQSVLAIQSLTFGSPPQFFIAPNITAPIGTTLTFSPSNIAPSSTPPINATLPSNSNSLFSSITWPALNEALELLQQTNPSITQALSNLVPSARAPAQIAPAIMLFLAALKGGEMSAWMGERPFEMLRRLGKSDIISRLNSDFSSLSKASTETLANDWRGFLLPFNADTNLQNIAVFYRQEDNEQEGQDPQKQTRFIFDMDLSRMGMVQIDGLFQNQSEDKRLEIVLRTEAPLSDTMKQMLMQNYTSALNEINIRGTLSFQSSKDNFITILEREEKMELVT